MTVNNQSFAETHAEQIEAAYQRSVREIKKLTREINAAVMDRNFGRVAYLTQQLDTFVSLRSW